MRHAIRHLLSRSQPCTSSSRSPRFVLWRILFSLVLIAACVLALPRTSHAQLAKLLYTFGTTTTDGATPYAGLIQAKDGNLYGTTYEGGANGDGTVFRVSTNGTAFTTLHSFSGTDGANPYAGLIQAKDGNLYGTTEAGGANGYGSVFKITTEGTLATLYSFAGGSDGATPHAGLIQAKDGYLYGTTSGGDNGAGTVFKITTAGKLTTFYNFSATDSNEANSDGAFPNSLIQATGGYLCGTCSHGGANGYGTVFQMTTGGTHMTVYSFSGADGANPYAALVEAKNGNLYGTTSAGSARGDGTVFRITTTGTLTTLYSFSGTDGANPYAALIQAKDGYLYGTTTQGGVHPNPFSVVAGTVFRITTAGALTTLQTFASSTDGEHPYAALMQAKDGSLYGTTIDAGEYDLGTLFSVDIALVLVSVTPNTANAAGPAFAVTLKGSHFTTDCTAQWTSGGVTTPLTTAYVSSTQLDAEVPASLIANAGTAYVTIVDGSGDVSNSQPFNIPRTTLKLSSVKVTKTSTGNYTANITLKNTGYLTASNVAITQATLGAAATSTTLSAGVGSIAKGKTGSTSLSFPSTAGSSSATVTLTVTGTFTGGSFTGSLKVKLP